MKFNSFIKECSDKEVFKRLSIYVVTSWVLIQVLSVIYEPLALPEKSVSILLIILLICFPFYIYYIWYSQLSTLSQEEDFQTKKGIKKYSEFRNTYFSFMGVIGFLCIASAFYITRNYFANENLKLTTFESSNKIGILAFSNNTGDREKDVIGKMTSDWITHGITENNAGQVISPEILNDYVSIIKASNVNPDNAGILKQYFRPGKVITGSYFLDNSKLLLRASIMDGNIDETLISFKPIQCDEENPLECIDELKEKILFYLAESKNENFRKMSVEENPPKYKAYEYLLESKASNISDELELELINKAIEEDPNFFEPKVLQIAFYYNDGQYQKADSLLQNLQPTTYNSNKRQINLVHHYEALLAGDNRKVYETILNEYNYTPFDLITNASTMVVAVNFVRDLNGVDSLYTAIDMQEMNFDDCGYCSVRNYMKSFADLGLGKNQEVIKRLEPIKRDIEDINLKKMLLAAYVRSNQDEKVNNFIEEEELRLNKEAIIDLYLYAGKEFLLKKDKASALPYFDRVRNEKYPEAYKSKVAEAFFYLNDFKTAEIIYQELLKEEPEDLRLISTLAAIYYLNDKKAKGEEILTKLRSQKSIYQFGALEYELARYYANIGDGEESLNQLLKSIAQGNYYTPYTFINDPVFLKYQDSQKFQQIMTYWQ